MVSPVQNVEETQFYELSGGLGPARVQMNRSRIAEKFKRADCAARRKKTKRDDHPIGQPVEAGMNREARLVGLNGILEEHVQHQLVPEDSRVIREFRTHDVREGLVV